MTTDDEPTPEGPRPPWVLRADDDRIDIGDEAPEPPVHPQPNGRCRACDADHITWQCPKIHALLFAPARYRCDSCNDPADHPGLCVACIERGERQIIGSLVHDGLSTLDITPSRRKTDYTFDVFLNGLWVASAKNYAAADDAACAIWAATKARIVRHVQARILAPLDVDYATFGW